MGYIKHHAIIVTGWDEIECIDAHNKAKEIFIANDIPTRLVSNIMEGISNSQYTFMIAPDGSKEGWETSNNCDRARKEFLDWLSQSENYCDYVEIAFGGDYNESRVVRDKDSDLEL